jgi:hypothetical protein
MCGGIPPVPHHLLRIPRLHPGLPCDQRKHHSIGTSLLRSSTLPPDAIIWPARRPLPYIHLLHLSYALIASRVLLRRYFKRHVPLGVRCCADSLKGTPRRTQLVSTARHRAITRCLRSAQITRRFVRNGNLSLRQSVERVERECFDATRWSGWQPEWQPGVFPEEVYHVRRDDSAEGEASSTPVQA